MKTKAIAKNGKAESTIPIRCSYTELRDVAKLKPHPRNPNKHPAEQIALFARLLKHQGIRRPVVVSKRSGYVVAGHGLLQAAVVAGLKQLPVDVQDFKTEADEWAHLVADNRLAELAELDKAATAEILRDLGEAGLDQTLTAFDGKELSNLIATLENSAANGNDKERFAIFKAEEILEAAFQYFRKSGFPYPNLTLFECMQEINSLAALPTDQLLNSRLGYRVADTYHPHRFIGHAWKMLSPLEAFADDKLLRRALAIQLETQLLFQRRHKSFNRRFRHTREFKLSAGAGLVGLSDVPRCYNTRYLDGIRWAIGRVLCQRLRQVLWD